MSDSMTPAEQEASAMNEDSHGFNRTLGGRVRSLRKHYGWTQQQLAERMMLKQHTVSRYELGEFELSVWQLAVLSSIFAITIESWFVDDATWQSFVRQL